jgi:hypothetical protein
MSAADLSHAQLLLILGICFLPALLQFVLNDRVDWIWMLLTVAAAVFVVVAW